LKRLSAALTLFDWSDEITADCRRKIAMNMYDACAARCPDLPKVV
jgi:hypothetical protein